MTDLSKIETALYLDVINLGTYELSAIMKDDLLVNSVAIEDVMCFGETLEDLNRYRPDLLI